MPRFKAVDNAGNYVAFFTGVLLENDLTLGLTQTLEDDLLRSLGRYATSILGKDFDIYDVAYVCLWVVSAGFLEIDLGPLVLDLFHNSALGENAGAAIRGVDFDDQVCVGKGVFLVSGGKGSLNRLKVYLLGHVLFRREQGDRAEEGVL